jgi:hypothetical protein
MSKEVINSPNELVVLFLYRDEGKSSLRKVSPEKGTRRLKGSPGAREAKTSPERIPKPPFG